MSVLERSAPLSEEEAFLQETEEFVGRCMARLFGLRTLLVTALFALALWLTGVPPGKGVAFCGVMYLMHVMPLARRLIELLAFTWVTAALVCWLDLPFVGRLTALLPAFP